MCLHAWLSYAPFSTKVVNAGVRDSIVPWNTVCLERATQTLIDSGKLVNTTLLQHLSPLGWEYINLTGDYVWRQSQSIGDGQFWPLRLKGNP